MACFICGSEDAPFSLEAEDRQISCCDEHRYYVDLVSMAEKSGHTFNDVLIFIEDINIMFAEAIEGIQDCIGTEDEEPYDAPNLRIMHRLYSLAFSSPAMLMNLFKAYLDL